MFKFIYYNLFMTWGILRTCVSSMFSLDVNRVKGCLGNCNDETKCVDVVVPNRYLKVNENH